MATYSTLKSRIALDLKRNDLTARIEYAVADAVAQYQATRFAFNQRRTTFNTAAGTEFYDTGTIPDDIGEIDALTLTVNGRRVVLDKSPFSVSEWANSSTTSQGQPRTWAWYAQQLRLYPVPDATYTLTLSYLQRIDAPAVDGDSNVWTNEAEPLIRAAAERIVYRDSLRNPAGEQAAASAEAAAYRRLKREAWQLDTGRLLPSGI